jgi:hypothetical protein
MTPDEAVATILSLSKKDQAWLDNFLSLPQTMQQDVINLEKDQDWTDPSLSSSGPSCSLNKLWWGRRLPTPGQCFRLLLAIFSLIAMIPMWWGAVSQDDTMSGWAEVLGCLAVGWFAVESSVGVVVDLVRRSPLPPPPKPRLPPPPPTLGP